MILMVAMGRMQPEEAAFIASEYAQGNNPAQTSDESSDEESDDDDDDDDNEEEDTEGYSELLTNLSPLTTKAASS